MNRIFYVLLVIKRLLLFFFLIVISSCAKWQALESDAFKNALIIKPSEVTKADNGILTSDGETVYTIGSVFVAENASPDLKAGIYYSTYRFYQKKFDKYPGLREESLLVSISGMKYSGVEYTAPGQHINRIAIMGIDESFGLGTTISIPMVEGKYNGGNPLIKDVQIKSFKLSSNTITLQPGQLFPTENDIVINADADINIVITSTAGVILTLSYIDDVTLGDGLAY